MRAEALMAAPLFLDTGYVIALNSPLDRNISQALSTDAHFAQAGFEVLLHAAAR